MRSLVFVIFITLYGSIALQAAEEKVQIKPQKVRPAIFANDEKGEPSARGTFHAAWSKFGPYLQQVVDSVQIQRDQALEKTDTKPPTGTIISLTFRLQKTGEVTDIVINTGDPDSPCSDDLQNRHYSSRPV